MYILSVGGTFDFQLSGGRTQFFAKHRLLVKKEGVISGKKVGVLDKVLLPTQPYQKGQSTDGEFYSEFSCAGNSLCSQIPNSK